jgi:hypothetical protein
MIREARYCLVHCQELLAPISSKDVAEMRGLLLQVCVQGAALLP